MNLLILQVVVFHFIYLFCFAKSGKTFLQIFGGSNDDSGNRARPTTDGGYISTGMTKSFGAVQKDVFIAKHDSNGDVVWMKVFRTAFDDENGYDVQQLNNQSINDTGFIVIGQLHTSALNLDIFIVKLFLNGSVEWMKTIGLGGQDYGRRIQHTNDGGYILCGYSNSFGGFYDWVVIKLDKFGNVTWTRGIGSVKTDHAYSVVPTSDGGYLVSGHYNIDGINNADLLVVKLNSIGDISWSKSVGGSTTEYTNGALRELSDGSFVLGGGYNSAGSFGSHDFWVIRFDSSGTVIWDRLFGGSGWDMLRDVTIVSDGGIVSCGEVTSYSSSKSCLVMKLDSSTGSVIWVNVLNSPYDDYCNSCDAASDNGLVVMGNTKGFKATTTDSDIFISKLDSDGNAYNWAEWTTYQTKSLGISSVVRSIPRVTQPAYNSVDVFPTVASVSPNVSFVNINFICGACYNGACYNGIYCLCDDNYYGPGCNITQCDGFFSNETESCGTHGTCYDFNKCDCEDENGWFGEMCNITKCHEIYSNQTDTVCGNHGTCYDFNKCDCEDENGWFGEMCNITKCHEIYSNQTDTVCGNHGTCYDFNKCDCGDENGWFGEMCNITICHGIYSNQTTVCGNHGTCYDFNKCDCEDNYYGEECNVTRCYDIFSNSSTICSTHGSCSTFEICQCDDNYLGIDCYVTMCNSIYSNTSEICSTHGTCSVYEECQCSDNFFGGDCSVTRCYDIFSNLSSSCGSHGKCEEYNNCDCEDNYYGEECNVTRCYDILSNLSSSCGSHGKCEEYNNCDCDSGYVEPFCLLSTCGLTCNLSNGQCNGEYCSCKSGYFDTNCNSMTSCGDWKSSDLLSTDFVPTLLSSSRMESNQIILNFESPVVTERYNYQLKIGGVSGNVCDSFVGPGWIQGSTNCSVTNDGILSWDDIENLCGWDTSSSTADMAVYKNTIYFTVKEELSPVHRSIEWDFDVIVSIPSTVIVDVVNIDVLAPVSLTAVLYEQNVNPSALNGFFKLFTRVDYPYQLTFDSVITDPSLIVSTVSVLGSACLPGSGECDQEWINNIGIHASKCDVSGIYTYRFLLNCRPGYSSCPYTNEIVDITTTIVSEEFCDPIQIETDISATMESCEDFACGSPENGFLTTETSFYEVTVVSQELDLHESEVISVWLTGAANVNYLINRNITADGILANFAETAAVKPKFQFDLDNLVTGVYTVHAKVAVTYAFETTRRTIVTEEVYKLNVEKDVVVINTHVGGGEGSSNVVGIMLGLIVMIFAVFY